MNEAKATLTDRALVVHPGDTLIIQAEPQSTLEQLDTLHNEVRRALPGVKVLTIATKQMFVVRDSGGAPE